MKRAGTLFSSSIGRKWIVAVTGLLLFGYVLMHLIGNLLVYLGPVALNEYGLFLRELLHGAGLWIARAVLLTAVGLHIWATIGLSLENASARAVDYRRTHYEAATYASRTMIWGGLTIALFVVYHILHFTTGQAHPDFVHGDIYHNVIVGFSNPVVVFVYVVAMLALGVHLYHGAWSMLQTMGLDHPRWDGTRKRAAATFAVVIVAGNVSMPIAVLTGLVR